MNRVLGHLRSNAIAYAALFVALSGVAYAAVAPKNSVRTKSIKNGQVKEVDLGADSVTTGKVKQGSITNDDIATGGVQTEEIQNEGIGPDDIAPGVTLPGNSMQRYFIEENCAAALSPPCTGPLGEDLPGGVGLDVSCTNPISDPGAELTVSVTGAPRLDWVITKDGVTTVQADGSSLDPTAVVDVDLVADDQTDAGKVSVVARSVTGAVATIDFGYSLSSFPAGLAVCNVYGLGTGLAPTGP